MASTGSLLKKTIFRVFAFAVMVTVGSFVFSILERQNADNTSKKAAKLFDGLREEMEMKYNMSQSEFDSFAKRSHKVISLLGGPKWNYLEGLRFAFETLTTIGYGVITPSTVAGQGLCIAFAFLGIPVTILTFQAIGELLSRAISSFISKTERTCFKREPSHVEAKCTVVTFVLMIITLVSGAGLQILIENWTFLEGLYFWFITLTTIGYGDYMLERASEYPLRVTLHLVWTTLGLCVVSSVLNAFATFIEKRRQLRSEVCYCDCLEKRGLENEEGYEKRETEINHNEKNAYEVNGNQKNGTGVAPLNQNGTGKRSPGRYIKKPNLYRSMTYV